MISSVFLQHCWFPYFADNASLSTEINFQIKIVVSVNAIKGNYDAFSLFEL